MLSLSFMGGPRYMHDPNQDAMIFVCHYGRPDLVINFTCKPQYNDTTTVLLPGQKFSDGHGIIVRLFHRGWWLS